MMDIQITDEHLTKLEIGEDSVLILRVPRELGREETCIIRDCVLKRIFGITGKNLQMITIADDFEISLLDVDALRNLKAEIDAVIEKQSGG